MVQRIVIGVALAVGACGGGGGAATPTEAPSEPPAATCVPLLPEVGFTVPEGWRATRSQQGAWQLDLLDAKDPTEVWATVNVVRVELCAPLRPDDPDREVPLHAAFGSGYVLDGSEQSTSRSGEVKVHSLACVHGDRGTLRVMVHGHPAQVLDQVKALVTQLAEATDGLHSCKLQ